MSHTIEVFFEHLQPDIDIIIIIIKLALSTFISHQCIIYFILYKCLYIYSKLHLDYFFSLSLLDAIY